MKKGTDKDQDQDHASEDAYRPTGSAEFGIRIAWSGNSIFLLRTCTTRFGVEWKAEGKREAGATTSRASVAELEALASDECVSLRAYHNNLSRTERPFSNRSSLRQSCYSYRRCPVAELTRKRKNKLCQPCQGRGTLRKKRRRKRKGEPCTVQSRLQTGLSDCAS